MPPELNREALAELMFSGPGNGVVMKNGQPDPRETARVGINSGAAESHAALAAPADLASVNSFDPNVSASVGAAQAMQGAGMQPLSPEERAQILHILTTLAR